MTKTLALLTTTILILSASPASAHYYCEPHTVAAASGGGSHVLALTGTAIGVAAYLDATYLILSQKDQYDEPLWHPLACMLFGKDARVGNETEAHCD